LSYQKLWQQVAITSNELANSASLTKLQASDHSVFVTEPLLDDRDDSIRLYPELDDIKQCLINPSKFFMQRRLKVNLTQYWDETEVDEPFALDSLQTYILNEALLTTHLEGREDVFKQQQKSLGNLPAAGFAEYVLTQSEHKIAPLIEQVGNTLPDLGKMPPQSDSVTLEEYQLSGQLEHLISHEGRNADSNNKSCLQQVFHFRSGGFKAKQIINLWLEHLFACATGISMSNSIGLGINKKGEIDKCEFTGVNAEMAQHYLLALIEFMNHSYRMPQPFFLQLAFNYLTTDVEKQAGILDTALDSEFSELNDEFVQRCFAQIIEKDYVGFLLAQESLWQSLLAPLLEHKVEDRVSEEKNGKESE
jgi:exodeoxyribonuclease V gamma subunit